MAKPPYLSKMSEKWNWFFTPSSAFLAGVKHPLCFMSTRNFKSAHSGKHTAHAEVCGCFCMEHLRSAEILCYFQLQELTDIFVSQTHGSVCTCASGNHTHTKKIFDLAWLNIHPQLLQGKVNLSNKVSIHWTTHPNMSRFERFVT